jgi:microcystin-dependent protein
MKVATLIYTAFLVFSMVLNNTFEGEIKSVETNITSTISADPLLGEVAMFAGNFAPRGWAFCDGQLLNIMDNPALFSLLGTMYGGDGRTTFALPNLESESGVKYIIALQGVFPARN